MVNNAGMNNIPMIVDPMEGYLRALEMYGFDMEDWLSNDTMTIDLPRGTEDEYLRHYILGSGGPFTDFVVGVDVGVGWEYIPKNFKNKQDGIDAKDKIEEYNEKIDFMGTMASFATYYEVLGRASIVLTENALGNDFYFNSKMGITGIDSINPMTVDTTSIYKALEDPTGKEPYVQRYSLHNGINGTVNISQDRMIYATRNKFAKQSAMGVSMYQNALKELRAIIKFPRFREAIARKLANVFRHYTIDQEQFKNTNLGRNILQDEKAEREYLLAIQNLIMEQEAKHSSIATFKWVESNEKTYGGKEPNLDIVETQTIAMMGLKLGIPVELMAYKSDSMNRATLETIAEFFVQRRKTGSQRVYKNIIEYIANRWLKTQGFDGSFEIAFNPFVQENMASRMDRVGMLNQRAPDLLAKTELRGELGKSDEVNFGDADDQIMKRKLEDMEIMTKAQQDLGISQNLNQQQTNQSNQPASDRKSAEQKAKGNALPEEKSHYATENSTNNGSQSTATSKKTTSNLSEIKEYLKNKGIYQEVET